MPTMPPRAGRNDDDTVQPQPQVVAPEPKLVRRRPSILNNIEDAGPKRQMMRQLSTKQGRRQSMKDSNERINAAPVSYNGFSNVIDKSSETILMRRSMSEEDLRGDISKPTIRFSLEHKKEEYSLQQLYKPRRESLTKRGSLIIPAADLEKLAKLATEDGEDCEGIQSFLKKNPSSRALATPPATSMKGHHRVQFKEVIIKSYSYIIGDNPCVSGGVPISLWEPIHTQSLEFEEYESLREGDRRASNELKIPKEVREDLLLDSGFSMNEIRKGIKLVNKTRIDRLNTRQYMYKAKTQERYEKIRRAFRNVFTGHNRREKAYIEHALSFTTLRRTL